MATRTRRRGIEESTRPDPLTLDIGYELRPTGSTHIRPPRRRQKGGARFIPAAQARASHRLRLALRNLQCAPLDPHGSLERLGPHDQLGDRPPRRRSTDAVAKTPEGALGRFARSPGGVVPDVSHHPAAVGRLRNRDAIAQALAVEHDDAPSPVEREKLVAINLLHVREQIECLPVSLQPFDALPELGHASLGGRSIDALAKARKGAVARLARTPGSIVPDVRVDPTPLGRMGNGNAIEKARVLEYDNALCPIAQAKLVALPLLCARAEVQRLRADRVDSHPAVSTTSCANVLGREARRRFQVRLRGGRSALDRPRPMKSAQCDEPVTRGLGGRAPRPSVTAGRFALGGTRDLRHVSSRATSRATPPCRPPRIGTSSANMTQPMAGSPEPVTGESLSWAGRVYWRNRCLEKIMLPPMPRAPARSPSDIAYEQVRAIALRFPSAEEKLSHGAPSFHVRGKMFLTFVDNHHGVDWKDVARRAAEAYARVAPRRAQPAITAPAKARSVRGASARTRAVPPRGPGSPP